MTCLIVGEVAQAHDGSLGLAHAFVDAIADAGADAVKFQTHIAEAESTPSEPWRVKFSLQDSSRYDYWRRMEFEEEQWVGLKKHAEDRGLKFLSSPFSLEAVALLERVGVAAWKVASGEINNLPMFERMAESRLPMFVSTGMSPLTEIDEIVQRIRAKSIPLILLQCTSMYPTPPEKVGLNMLTFFRERYGCAVGLSDHSGTIFPGLAAATLRADLVEVHVTLSRDMFGPDVIASVTTQELSQLVNGIRYVETIMSNPVNKDSLSSDLSAMRSAFNKSIVARRDIPAGTLLSEEDLTVKKPGTGIPASKLHELVGVKVRRDIKANSLLNIADLEIY